MGARGLAVIAFLLAGVPAVAQDIPVPAWVQLSPGCEGGALILTATVSNHGIEPAFLTVERQLTAFGLPGARVLLEDHEIPAELEGVLEIEVPDPDLAADDLGLYQARILAPDGRGIYETAPQVFSCRDDALPLMRGRLLEFWLFEPCTGQGLLECTLVNINLDDPEEYVGSPLMLEIHGVVQRLDGFDDCTARVDRIVPLEPGVDCDSDVPVAPQDWSGLKASYR